MTVPNEPPRISDGGENVDSWDHWKIYNSFTPLNTTEANNGAAEYSEIATRWTAAAELFANRINHSSTAAWDGAAANSSRDAIAKYARAALDLATPLQNLAGQVSAAAQGVNDTQTSVDKPPDGGSWYNPRSWNLGVYHGPNSAAVRNDCESAAREAMRTHYVNTFVGADKQIPVLPVPDSPTDPLYKPPENTSRGPNPGTVTPGSDNPSPGTTAPGADDPQGAQPADDAPTNTGADPSATTPASTTSPAQTPTGVPTNQPTSPSTPTIPSTTPSSYPSSPGTHNPGTPHSPGSATPPAPGRSVPGVPSAPGNLANAARAASNGAPGMPGMGMGPGPGRGQSKGDEESHQLPEWLRNMENTEELLGTVPKTVPGGVIGADPPEAGPTPN